MSRAQRYSALSLSPVSLLIGHSLVLDMQTDDLAWPQGVCGCLYFLKDVRLLLLHVNKAVSGLSFTVDNLLFFP